MENLNQTVENGNDTPITEEKTFTQEEMNRVVQERLARDRANAREDLERREKELGEREFALYATELLKENDLPIDIMNALDRSDKDTFASAVKILCQHMKKPRKLGSAAVGCNPGYQPNMRSEDGHIRDAMGLKK